MSKSILQIIPLPNYPSDSQKQKDSKIIILSARLHSTHMRVNYLLGRLASVVGRRQIYLKSQLRLVAITIILSTITNIQNKKDSALHLAENSLLINLIQFLKFINILVLALMIIKNFPKITLLIQFAPKLQTQLIGICPSNVHQAQEHISTQTQIQQNQLPKLVNSKVQNQEQGQLPLDLRQQKKHQGLTHIHSQITYPHLLATLYLLIREEEHAHSQKRKDLLIHIGNQVKIPALISMKSPLTSASMEILNITRIYRQQNDEFQYIFLLNKLIAYLLSIFIYLCIYTIFQRLNQGTMSELDQTFDSIYTYNKQDQVIYQINQYEKHIFHDSVKGIILAKMNNCIFWSQERKSHTIRRIKSLLAMQIGRIRLSFRSQQTNMIIFPQQYLDYSRNKMEEQQKLQQRQDNKLTSNRPAANQLSEQIDYFSSYQLYMSSPFRITEKEKEVFSRIVKQIIEPKFQSFNKQIKKKIINKLKLKLALEIAEVVIKIDGKQK